MEPTYTEWKEAVDAHNHFLTRYCPHCGEHNAKVMKRFYTNRDGESEPQYRVECPICKKKGKTYSHESVASMSWSGMEHDPNSGIRPPKKMKYYIRYQDE